MKLRNRQTGSEFELAADMVMGRSSECSLTVSDPSVSRRHARFELRSGTLWVVDLDSSNGLRLNGRRSREFALRPGDLLTVGAVAFDVVGEGSPAPPTAGSAPAPARPPAAPLAASDAGPLSLAEEERLRLRAEIKAARRSRGLGDLGQQPILIQILAVALGLALLAGLFLGVRWLGHLIAPQ